MANTIPSPALFTPTFDEVSPGRVIGYEEWNSLIASSNLAHATGNLFIMAQTWADGIASLPDGGTAPYAYAASCWRERSGTWSNYASTVNNPATSSFWIYQPVATGYVGAALPFGEMEITYAAAYPGVAQPTMAYEYWDGSAWSSLTVMDDDTGPGGGIGTTPAKVKWIPPSDWATTQVNGEATGPWYYVRMSPTAYSGSTTAVTTVTVSSLVQAELAIRELTAHHTAVRAAVYASASSGSPKMRVRSQDSGNYVDTGVVSSLAWYEVASDLTCSFSSSLDVLEFMFIDGEADIEALAVWYEPADTSGSWPGANGTLPTTKAGTFTPLDAGATGFAIPSRPLAAPLVAALDANALSFDSRPRSIMAEVALTADTSGNRVPITAVPRRCVEPEFLGAEQERREVVLRVLYENNTGAVAYMFWQVSVVGFDALQNAWGGVGAPGMERVALAQTTGPVWVSNDTMLEPLFDPLPNAPSNYPDGFQILGLFWDDDADLEIKSYSMWEVQP